MNIGILAARKDKALGRIAAIAPEIGKKYGAPEEMLARLTAESKDRDVEAMERLEATAELMEFLAQRAAEAEKAISSVGRDKTAKAQTEKK